MGIILVERGNYILKANINKRLIIFINRLGSRGQELKKVCIIEASPDKFLSGELAITVYIHPPEDIISSPLRSVKLVTLK